MNKLIEKNKNIESERKRPISLLNSIEHNMLMNFLKPEFLQKNIESQHEALNEILKKIENLPKEEKNHKIEDLKKVLRYQKKLNSYLNSQRNSIIW